MAKMTKCKVCGADMASNAKACPQCGAKNKKPIYKRWWFWVICVLVLFGAISSAGSKDSSAKGESGNEHEMQAQGATTVSSPLDDDIIDVDISKCHVKYLRHELVENMAGEKCAAVYYEFTNNDADNKAFMYVVNDKAFQDGVELKSSLFHVSDESHDKSAEIKTGVTITVCSAFELRDETTDIELEIEPWVNLSDSLSDKMVLSIS